MRKIILYILAAVLIVAAFFGSQLIADSKQKIKPKAQKVIKTVFVDTVKNTSVPIVIPANGNLIAKRRIELFSEVQGVFRQGSKLFKPGQEYRKGQTLIAIDASEYYASVQSAKSNFYNSITSIMPDLRLDYPEAFPKWQSYLNNLNIDKSLPALPEMTSEKEKYFINNRGIVTSYYNIKNLEQRLGKYRITAPFSGILTEALVTEGTLISGGQKLGEFIDGSVYEMEVSIGKEYSDLLKIGEKVALQNLEKTKNYTGTVTRVNGKIDQATQSVKVFIEVKDDTLKEGMYLEANVTAKNEDNAIAIDRSLLQNGNEIFVVKDSLLSTIKVTPVYFSDTQAVIKDVPEGEIIVSKPITGGYAGMLVKVYSEEKVNQETEASKSE
ncbi:efflux RND transporter periplasmic adaptor subunit [Patiriisocius hiemis]|uniref:HlyD family efflux transporter periplasmic adaptor subunit n=1 Tax=Patiriisocius hiemis TaxID=3075604 RepID=A0ABU2YDF5_9FLAO|nr:HlyD family efflux transporter periplasmic adaptor subunit [Constantimarinum sp. W242]MDT0556222.1 HlyD family efflux transporter periplasmic adaptor subunit [Constantimarinum sp. W242]